MFPAFTELSRVELTLYTDALITHGFVRTRQHRITDILNLADAAVPHPRGRDGRGAGRARPPIRADVAQINLDSVLFAVANIPIEASPELRTPKKPTDAIVLRPAVPDHRHDPPDGRRVRRSARPSTSSRRGSSR